MKNQLGILLVFAFLFCVGAFFGWCIEVVFRKFFSKKNPSRKWINPGFVIGPCLPLYGCGLVVLFSLALVGDLLGYGETLGSKIVLFFLMGLLMTLVEFIAGLIAEKGFHMRLWDYSGQWGNIMGLICPKFALFWTLLSAAYYFLLQPTFLRWVYWLADHLSFAFFIGMYYGILIIDLVYSINMARLINRFGKDNKVIIQIQELQHQLHLENEKKGLYNFFFDMRVGKPVNDKLEKDAKKGISKIMKKLKK